VNCYFTTLKIDTARRSESQWRDDGWRRVVSGSDLVQHIFRGMKAGTFLRVCLGCGGVVAILACAHRARQDSAPQQLLSFRLVRDSLRPVIDGDVAEVAVQFVVRNVSDKPVYRTNGECGNSPMYWVERLEADSSGRRAWHHIFSADCTGDDSSRPLLPLDSSVFVSRLVQFPGQTPAFAFSNDAEVYRFVYIVSTSPGVAGPNIRVPSPPVLIRPPN
jgi:hypothetical protein